MTRRVIGACGARSYLEPLIRGEAFPPFQPDGLPAYAMPKFKAVKKKLAGYSIADR